MGVNLFNKGEFAQAEVCAPAPRPLACINLRAHKEECASSIPKVTSPLLPLIHRAHPVRQVELSMAIKYNSKVLSGYEALHSSNLV